MDRIVTGLGWKLRLLEGWTDKREFGEQLLVPPDGGPVVTIGTSKISGGLTENDLRELARDHIAEGHRQEWVKLGDFNGLGFRYIEDGLYYRHWYVTCGRMWLQINYDCHASDQGQYESDIDRILGSLVADVAAI